MKISYKKIISCLLAVIMLTSLVVLPAHASIIDNSFLAWYELLKSGNKSTDYGLLTGEIYGHAEYNDNSSTLLIAGYTLINTSYTMRKVSTNIECVRTSTGTSEPGWKCSHSTANANEDLGYLYLYSLASGERITIYTAHQILYTKTDILYQVTQTAGVTY